MGLAIGGPRRRLEGRFEFRYKLGERGDEDLQTGKSQHGREGPQLGDGEWRALLISVDEAHRVGEAELHVGGFEHAVRQQEHPRHSLAFGRSEAWQAAIEGGWHVLADLPDRPANVVVVVEKPLRRLGGVRRRIGAATARAVQPAGQGVQFGPDRRRPGSAWTNAVMRPQHPGRGFKWTRRMSPGRWYHVRALSGRRSRAPTA